VARSGASEAPAGTAPILRPFDPGRDSGPAVAGVFQRAYAAVLLVAWASLASQVELLAGRDGLAPAAELLARAREQGLGWLELPTLFWLGDSDAWLQAGAWLGMALALLALWGVRPRACFALSAPLYLSYATVCGEFLAFQWDNLLIESALLAACLPAGRPSRLAHFALRALLFKLYFESGIAKWQSHLHDWHDGSAMLHYYETAPLPAALAFYAHHLPPLVHKLESWGALLLELPLPWLIWGPRPARLIAFAALTGFQIVNTATANYGFFTYITLTLHLFLLSDGDIERARGALRRFRRKMGRQEAGESDFAFPPSRLPVAPPRRALRALAGAALALWVLASINSAWIAFGRGRARRDGALAELANAYSELRVANVYHLFGHITRERIEPQLETWADGAWHEADLWYKPGDLGRRPPYVAPHQPRVDFRLWFYGLSFQRGTPDYVVRLQELVCDQPGRVQALFADGLPAKPEAVRISFHRYRFASLDEHARSGAYWSRETLGALAPRRCR
jgi:lipase maturation factor 1